MAEVSLIQMEHITKRFSSTVTALEDVQFELRKGEIHALLGENGAGKSTLIKVLTGVEERTEGSIALNGTMIHPKSPLDAQSLGISTVYQEVNLCPNLSVAENIYIGRERMKRKRIDWKAVNQNASKLMERFELDIDVTRTLDSYSVAIQQMVAIARACDISSKVLILDEPTSSLSEVEVKKLFEIMKKLKQEGMGILFVTHFIDQVYEVCDRITVLRNSKYVGTYETKDLPRVELVGKMIGKDYVQLNQTLEKDSGEKQVGELLVRLKEITKAGSIKAFNLDIHKGEVLGLSGLLGSGRTETARIIFGVDHFESGSMEIKGRTAHFKSTLDAIRHQIAFCPENRKIEGIVGDLSIRENIILALQAKRGIFHKLSNAETNRIADEYIEKFQIKTPSANQFVKNLSGGNQQKVILARWMATEPELLILDEPTRGIDIGTKAEIQKIVIELAKQGMAVVFISSEIDEMLRCCKRMIVLRNFHKVAELKGQEISQGAIMEYIAGGGNREVHKGND